MKNNLLLFIIIGFILINFNGGGMPIVDPEFDSPMSTYVFKESKSINREDKKRVAECFQRVHKDILKLADPLYQPSYSLRSTQDAVSAVQSLVTQTSSNPNEWDDVFEKIDQYVKENDDFYKDDAYPNRGIYAIGEQFKTIAVGLDPSLLRQSDELLNNDSVILGEKDKDADISSMYMNNNMVGVFLDEPSQPDMYRKIAISDKRILKASSQKYPNKNFKLYFKGEGKNNRAVYWNYAFRMDPNAYRFKQIDGNCVFASSSTICTVLNGVNAYLLGKPNAFEAEGSSVWYAFRGHGSAGSTCSRAAWAYLEYGYPLMKDYGVIDLSDPIQEQKIGIENWRSPEQSLAELIEITKKTPIGKIEEVPSNISQDDLNDVLYGGACVHFGGTLIGREDGDPVSSVGSVSPHAMATVGYDDTQEFKDWYREKTGKTLNESVYIFDNTWGEGPQYVKSNWPSHLWGKQTGGTYVLKYSDAIKLIRNGYIWYPNLVGVTPEIVNYRLRLSKLEE